MMRSSYHLGFISDEHIYNHVKETIQKYRFDIDLERFNENIVDPIKLTFDSLIYKREIKNLIEQECLRQLDKSNTNQLGYFHQNIFRYISDEWEVPSKGFDIINTHKKIYGEIKNKHNTMNSSSAKSTFLRMQSKLLSDSESTCYLIEVIAKRSQNIPWHTSVDGEKMSHDRIRRISMDKFYELVTGDTLAFKKLCEKLPMIIQDVLQENAQVLQMKNTVFQELQRKSPDILASLYLVSFQTYEGFTSFHVQSH